MNSRNVIPSAIRTRSVLGACAACGVLLVASAAVAQEPAADAETPVVAAEPPRDEGAVEKPAADAGSPSTVAAEAASESADGDASEAAALESTSGDASEDEAPVDSDAGEVENGASAPAPADSDAIPDLRGATRATQRRSLGLEPSAPQATSILGGVTPAFGEASQASSDWVFDIHGFLLLPLRLGINEREDAGAGQKTTVLHTPPVVPGDFESFEYSGINPDPWAQLNFNYGNQDVTATIIIAARSVSNANGYFDPTEQLGINDAFMTFHPKTKTDTQWNVHVGAFANRYGIMGEYDMGRYGTPVIGRLGGVGATGTTAFKLGDMDATLEAGVMGQLNKSPVGVEPAGWNGFTDPNAGTSFAGHGHMALGVTRNVQFGAHAIYAFSQDDRATTTTQKDGNIGVYGGDVRLTMQRYGHFYFGYGFTNAQTARPVSAILRVLNSAGGLGLMEEYFGLESEGTGQLHTFGAQYDWSLGNFMRYPKPFNGKGPDVVLSAFAMGTKVSSPVPEYDDIFKMKFGGAATYSFLPWMAAGVRYDRVSPDTSDNTQTHAIISPRLIFKSNWASRDQIMLQYSAYMNGSNVAPKVGYPAQKDPTVTPDSHVVSLTGSIWW